MSDITIPDGFWAILTAVFALLFLLLLLKGLFLGALVAVAAAVWTGFETRGRGPVTTRR
jgi:hypothetical protein